MPIISPLFTPSVPGVYVSEGTYGVIPSSLASHKDCYMLGYSSKVGAPTVPTFVSSPEDFVNVFGSSSASYQSVKLFFNQRSGQGLWFLNVPLKVTRTLTVPTATPAATYTLTLNGTAISYVATSTDTVATIGSALSALVNNQYSHLGYITNGLVVTDSATTATVSANLTLGSVVTPTLPDVASVVTYLRTKVDSGLRQGFLIAPEYFQGYTALADRTALALAMDAFCADPNYRWVAIADCGSTTATSLTGSGAINLAIQERSALSSPLGTLAYYFPYWVDVDGSNVPMSASVVGIALRRYRDQGYSQPPAGIQYSVYGVKDISFAVTDQIQGQLNPLGINCGRKLPNGKGIVVYAARTVSANSFYRYLHTRVILNVLGRTLEDSLQSVVFTTVDGLGVIFSQLKATATSICERLRLAGALYGATAEEAYLVICDATNNPGIDLEQGIVSLDVLVKPSPIAEFINIRLTRVGLSSDLREVLGSGDSSAVKDSKDVTSTNKAN